MKTIVRTNILIIILFTSFFPSCKKDFGNLNSPTVEEFLNNASRDQLNNLVSGTESAMRINLGLYLDDVGVIGREMYRFSIGDPRYTTDLLGAGDATLNNTGFYITNTWASRYRVVKNCNTLIQAANNSSLISDAEKKGYTGFAKTVKAYQLLLTLNLTYTNGIRLEVSDPNQLGPIVDYETALSAIANLLDEAKTDLGSAQVSFPLSSGFAGFGDAAGLVKVNRALAARVAVYRKQWPDAITALNESFFNINGGFSTGVYHMFGTGSGDQLNSAFFPQNQAGDVRLAHPTYAADIEPNDDRISKSTQRADVAFYQGLSGDRDVWVYTSSTAPAPIVRNEELILIFAEANIQLNNFSAAITALNVVRNAHHLNDYSGASTHDALINEMLYERRYSLFYEGHRWIDMRRYDKLGELPVDRTGDDVWPAMPTPQTEGQ